MKQFDAKLGSEDQGSLFFEVPFDVKAVFGKARPPVRVTINGHSYRSTISVYGGRSYVPVRKSNRDAARVSVGDVVRVTLEPDGEPRVLFPLGTRTTPTIPPARVGWPGQRFCAEAASTPWRVRSAPAG